MLDIPKSIRMIRNARDMSSGDLARKSKLSAPMLSLVEQGKRSPSLDALKRIAKSLRVPFDLFVVVSSLPCTSADPRVNGIINDLKEVNAAEERLQLLLINYVEPAKKRKRCRPLANQTS